MYSLNGQVVNIGMITLIITLGEWEDLTDDQYLGNILTFSCALTALCFVAATTCGTRHCCGDESGCGKNIGLD